MKKCFLKFGFLSLLFVSFGFGLFIQSSPVSALSLSSAGGQLNPLASGAIFGLSDGTQVGGSVSNSNLISQTWLGSKTLDTISYRVNGTIPADALTTFTIQFNMSYPVAGSGVSARFKYFGINMADGRVILMDSCVDQSGGSGTYQGKSFACTITYLNRYETSTVDTLSGARILQPQNQAFSNQDPPDVNVVVSGVSFRKLNNDSLSADDRSWLEDVLGSSTDVSSVVSAINNLRSDTQATTNAINNLRSDTQAQTDAIEQGNDDAQDRWEKDKQEEAEREEQGKDDADELGSIFKFEIRNPFAGLLSMFTNNCPVSIPIIASMIGSNQTVYPCWFSQQTRSILTPVFGLASSVLLFGFIVRGFLNKGKFSGGLKGKFSGGTEI